VKQLRSVEQKRLHRSWQRRTDQRAALLLDACKTVQRGKHRAHRAALASITST
jgi:hypothetical protein